MFRLSVLLILFLVLNTRIFAQIKNREPKESSEAFLGRISSFKLIPGQIIKSDFNTKGEKLIYFYTQYASNLETGKEDDSLQTLRMVILVADTLNPLNYFSTDLELDADRGYGLGIESTELVKSKKEKSLKINVFHLVPGPGRVRMKGYENFILKQRSNNAGFFDDFELIRQR